MKTRYLIVLAAMGLLASCSKEQQEPVSRPDVARELFHITVGISDADGSKTSLGESDGSGTRKVYWSDGDRIAVNGIESEALASLAENTSSAEFTFATEPSVPYSIVYPSSVYTDANTITLPQAQAYASGTFADNTYPLAGYSSDGSGIALSPLCAIVKISVKLPVENPDTDNICLVQFSGGASEQVSGEFTLDYSSHTLTATSSADADKLVKILVNHSLSTTASDYYFVVPAGEYSSGFNVKIQDINGHYMTKGRSTATTLSAGHLYSMPEFEFVPTATELGIEISTAAQLVQFASDFNAGLYGDNDLVATLVADIDFNDGTATSADFNATGGIGTADDGNGNTNYFHGLFNGNGKTISNLQATVPVFAYSGSTGIIKDFTIDNTCSFTFTPSTDASMYAAAAVGYHKGDLSGVTVNADVELAEVSGVAKLTALGGLVGRATTGTVSDCTYAGIISTPSGFTSTAKLLIGGIVGYFSNSGSVSGSDFKGTICNEAQITSTDKKNPYSIIGGIVGYLGGGATVTGCTTAEAATKVAGAYSGSEGTIVSKTTIAYYSAVGGIVGELEKGTVSSCINGADILLTIFRGSNEDASARYIKTGGIAGVNRADGTIAGCTNNGRIIHRSNPRLQSVGGIVGFNEEGAAVSGSSNNADIAISTAGTGSYSARIPYLGGVIGENYSTAISDVHNTGDLEVSRIENTASHFVCIGGVAGYNMAAIDGGTSKNITNSGKIYESGGVNSVSTAGGHNLGGIAGYSEASVHNAVNTGYIHYNFTGTALTSEVYLGGIVGRIGAAATVSGCENNYTSGNEGEVFMQLNNYAHKNLYAGGILGYSESDVTLSGNVNSGYVHGGNASKQNGCLSVFGGIVGYLAGASSISECDNSAVVYNDSFNNTITTASASHNGGIAGYVAGTSEQKVSITGCHVTASALGPRRGYSGGIVGTAIYTEVTNCTFSGNFSGSAYYVGGIAGIATNSSISSCTYSGTTIQSSQINNGGGIVAILDAGTSIDGCQSYATTINKNGTAITAYGGIAGASVAGSTISNSHYSSSIQICSDANYTDGGGNTADL